MDIKEGERGSRLAPSFRDAVEPRVNVSHLVFVLFC